MEDLPYSNECEAGALACVLDCENPEQFLAKLSLSDFLDERHRFIYTTLQELAVAGLPLTIVSLVQRLMDRKMVARAGGNEYLTTLPDCKVSVAQFPAYLHEIRRLAVRRQTIDLGRRLVQLSSDLRVDDAQVEAECARVLAEVERRHKRDNPVLAPPIGDLRRTPEDDTTTLLGNRYLCERGGMLVTGPTGVGKSSLVLQALALWAVGRPFMGIHPRRPLTSLLVQAENDEGDMAEMRDGIVRGLNLSEDDRQAFYTRVLCHTSTGVVGRRFFDEVVGPLLSAYRPNLICIDPALSFLGGDVKEQRDVGNFLRQWLNPQLFANNCASLVVHHTNKPRAKDDSPQNGDWAYQGSGSAEWANWARAVISLQASGQPGVYKLHAGKRGARIGWRNRVTDEVEYERVVVHSRERGVICWHEQDEGYTPDRGRDKSYDDQELVNLLDERGLTTGDWRKAAKSELGISEATFHRARRELERSERVFKSRINGCWTKVLKSSKS